MLQKDTWNEVFILVCHNIIVKVTNNINNINIDNINIEFWCVMFLFFLVEFSLKSDIFSLWHNHSKQTN